MKEWRKELADQIRAAADNIYKEADRLADQPDYMVSDGFSITIDFDSDRIPIYTVRHEHLVRKVGRE